AERPLALHVPRELGSADQRSALTPHPVKRPVLGRRHQPSRRVLGDTPYLPHFECPAEGVLRNILGQGEVVHPEDAGERGEQRARLAPEEMLTQLHAQYCSFITGRPSTLPEPRSTGQPRANSSASASSFA